MVGCNQNAFGDLKNAAISGLKYGAIGFLNTDWGDYGHWQPLPVSYPAYLFGAAVSWGVDANQQIDIGKLVARYIFDDSTGQSGRALVDIGNAYHLKIGDNTNFRFHNMLAYPGRALPKSTTAEGLQAAIDYMDKNLQLLLKAPMASEDAKIVKAELTLAVNMAKLACKIGLARFTATNQELEKVPASKRNALSAEYENLIKEHQKLWILRNRPGGLDSSVRNLERGMIELKK